jgi:hypothetical protein
MPSHRAFPLEAIVLFPLLGPPALALAGAALYAAVLVIFLLSPKAIIALPIYFVFWAKLAYAALWPSAAAAGVLYALAVGLFAPPVLVTAMVAGAVAALGYGIGLMLLGSLDAGTTDSRSVVIGAAIGLAQVVPGWWASQKMRGWLATRKDASLSDK